MLTVHVPPGGDLKGGIVHALRKEDLYSPDLLYRNPGRVYDTDGEPEVIDTLLMAGTDRTEYRPASEDHGFQKEVDGEPSGFQTGTSDDARDYVWCGEEDRLGDSTAHLDVRDGSLIRVYEPEHLRNVGEMQYEFKHPDQKDEALVALIVIKE